MIPISPRGKVSSALNPVCFFNGRGCGRRIYLHHEVADRLFPPKTRARQ